MLTWLVVTHEPSAVNHAINNNKGIMNDLINVCVTVRVCVGAGYKAESHQRP